MVNALSNTVSKFAPSLGAVLNLALPGSGLVVSALAHIFGADPKNEDDISRKIAADPDAYLKIQQFQMIHAEELEKIAFQDRDSARKRNIEVTKATGKNDNTLSVLAYAFVGGFFIYSFLLFFVHIDSTAHDIVLLLAGQISSMAITVAGFYFGSMMKGQVISRNDNIDIPSPDQTR